MLTIAQLPFVVMRLEVYLVCVIHQNVINSRELPQRSRRPVQHVPGAEAKQDQNSCRNGYKLDDLTQLHSGEGEKQDSCLISLS